MTQNDGSYYEKTVATKEIYNGNILKLELLTVELPNGVISQREIIRHNGACAVLAIQNDNFIIVKQYRKALDKVLYEIPAGKVEFDEDPTLCAQRELIEETGYVANKMDFLMEMYAAAGYSSEKIYIYTAENLDVSQASPDEDEIVTVIEMEIKKVYRMIMDGTIKDSKTICAVLKYLSLHSELLE